MSCPDIRQVIPPGSREYVYAAVESHENPTAATVSFGFSTDVDTEPETWAVGTWLADASPQLIDGTYVLANVARVLVSASAGGTATVLEPGTYAAWVKLALTPQSVVRPVGWVDVE